MPLENSLASITNICDNTHEVNLHPIHVNLCLPGYFDKNQTHAHSEPNNLDTIIP